MPAIKVGDIVAWRWAQGVAYGEVVAIVSERCEIFSKGKRIVRNGSVDNPALHIKHASNNPVLKLASEVTLTTEI